MISPSISRSAKTFWIFLMHSPMVASSLSAGRTTERAGAVSILWNSIGLSLYRVYRLACGEMRASGGQCGCAHPAIADWRNITDR